MASAKLFGYAINVDAEEEGGGGRSIAHEVSLSGIQPDDEAMSLLVLNSDSGSASMDSEPDLHNCFINFFDREQYEVEAAGEFYISPNQRVSTSGEFDIWGFHDTEDEIELGLRIGSGSGQLRSDSGGVGLEVGTGLTLVGGNLFSQEEDMVAVEEMEWEDLYNPISLVQEPVEVGLLHMEEESSLASRDDDDDDQTWQVLLPDNTFGIFEESAAIMVDSGLMDLDYGFFLDSLDEYGENNGDYNAVIEHNESGIMGRPPASKSIVINLPVVEITSEELRKSNIVCAICKDEIVVEEKVKRLPCRHYYHGECIIPWLGIRNTCPVCRYELPTDDLDYERRNRR